MLKKVSWAAVSALITALVLAIILGGIKVVKETRSIKNECRKTDFIVIGNRGLATPVYDGAKL